MKKLMKAGAPDRGRDESKLRHKSSQKHQISTISQQTCSNTCIDIKERVWKVKNDTQTSWANSEGRKVQTTHGRNFKLTKNIREQNKKAHKTKKQRAGLKADVACVTFSMKHFTSLAKNHTAEAMKTRS